MKNINRILNVSILAVLLMACGLVHGQTTTVTATITDSDSQTWNTGFYTVSLYNPTGGPYAYTNGTPITQTSWHGNMNSTGVLTVTLPDVNKVVPFGSTYQWILCSDTSASCSPTIQNVVVTGSSQNLSSLLSSQIVAPRFVASSVIGGRGYIDAEISAPSTLTGILAGTMYYALTNLCSSSPGVRVYNGSAWGCVGGGGGGGTITCYGGNCGENYLPVFATPSSIQDSWFSQGTYGNPHILNQMTLTNAMLNTTFPSWSENDDTCKGMDLQVGPAPNTTDPNSYEIFVEAGGCDGAVTFQTVGKVGPVFTALDGNYNALSLVNPTQNWNGVGTLLALTDSITDGHAQSNIGENYMYGNSGDRFPGLWGAGPPPGYIEGNPVPLTWFGFNDVPDQGSVANGGSEIIFTPTSTYLPAIASSQSTAPICPNGDLWGALTTTGCASPQYSQAVTIAPYTGTGTGATAVCASGYHCDTLSGTVTLTTGTGATALAYTLTTSPALPNNFNCTNQQTGPAIYTGAMTGSTTTVAVMESSGPAASSTAYQYTYSCNGVSGTSVEGVSQIIAGTNVTIAPSSGTGTVTINATGGGSGGYPTPETIVASSSSALNFTGCISSSYNNYQITFSNLIPSTASNVLIQMSANGGASYDTASNYWTGNQYVGVNAGGNGVVTNYNTGGFSLWENSSDNVGPYSGTLTMFSPMQSTQPVSLTGNGIGQNSSNQYFTETLGAIYKPSTLVSSNAFRVILSSGTITSGSVTCQPLPN